MAEYFMRIGYAKTKLDADKFADWTFGRATFDGQFGWNMEFSNTWDTRKALELVLRFIEMQINEEDAC
jgi:hypothetical protein